MKNKLYLLLIVLAMQASMVFGQCEKCKTCEGYPDKEPHACGYKWQYNPYTNCTRLVKTSCSGSAGVFTITAGSNELKKGIKVNRPLMIEIQGLNPLKYYYEVVYTEEVTDNDPGVIIDWVAGALTGQIPGYSELLAGVFNSKPAPGAALVSNCNKLEDMLDLAKINSYNYSTLKGNLQNLNNGFYNLSADDVLKLAKDGIDVSNNNAYKDASARNKKAIDDLINEINKKIPEAKAVAQEYNKLFEKYKELTCAEAESAPADIKTFKDDAAKAKFVCMVENLDLINTNAGKIKAVCDKIKTAETNLKRITDIQKKMVVNLNLLKKTDLLDSEYRDDFTTQGTDQINNLAGVGKSWEDLKNDRLKEIDDIKDAITKNKALITNANELIAKLDEAKKSIEAMFDDINKMKNAVDLAFEVQYYRYNIPHVGPMVDNIKIQPKLNRYDAAEKNGYAISEKAIDIPTRRGYNISVGFGMVVTGFRNAAYGFATDTTYNIINGQPVAAQAGYRLQRQSGNVKPGHANVGFGAQAFFSYRLPNYWYVGPTIGAAITSDLNGAALLGGSVIWGKKYKVALSCGYALSTVRVPNAKYKVGNYDGAMGNAIFEKPETVKYNINFRSNWFVGITLDFGRQRDFKVPVNATNGGVGEAAKGSSLSTPTQTSGGTTQVAPTPPTNNNINAGGGGNNLSSTTPSQTPATNTGPQHAPQDPQPQSNNPAPGYAPQTPEPKPIENRTTAPNISNNKRIKNLQVNIYGK